MTSAKLTAVGAVRALVLTGSVPAPPSISVLVASAEAAQPSNGSRKGKKKKKSRNRKKKKTSEQKQAAKAQKSATRAAKSQPSKPATKRVARKAPSRKSKREKSGDRSNGNFTAHAQAALAGVNMGLSVGRGQAFGDPAPPLPPRAQPSRKKLKKKAPVGRQAAASAKKAERQATGKTTKAALAPNNARNSGGGQSQASSVVTRQVRGDGATQIAARAQKQKGGRKMKFYFNPFKGLFGGRKTQGPDGGT